MTDDASFQEWLDSRPEEIRRAVIERDPRKLYRLKSTGHIVKIYSFDEPHNKQSCSVPDCGHSHDADEVTATVLVLSKYNTNLFFERRVFGIRLPDLEEVPEGTVNEVNR